MSKYPGMSKVFHADADRILALIASEERPQHFYRITLVLEITERRLIAVANHLLRLGKVQIAEIHDGCPFYKLA